ncbi:PREDICTED: probable polygalacturonase At1g80170 [Populus euphratica]|uniref:Probable polygalacturonase At1g80170 n=1 Tax=Populus euphratica TaxID=75702 RepID=A0AAJ6TAF9_POPEU|nr:PREDICTED: probable polygalacturonase At1g80170 [Populus euphratica]
MEMNIISFIEAKDLFAIISITTLISILQISVNAEFNVINYGASGNGITNDSLAFLRTWNNTCNAPGTSTMIIPKGKTFFLNPLTFNGPCKANKISVMFYGRVIAPDGPNNWKERDLSTWLRFKDIAWLTVSGSRLLDGRGEGWWDASCRYRPGKGCFILMPTAVRFEGCEHLQVDHINIVNSPQFHITLWGSRNAELRFLDIQSPESSPNTDGIHISSSNDVTVHDSIIGSGDDCISIGDYTSNITILDVSCGPGHGISIGSFGRGRNEVEVEGIFVSRANFSGTTNGARIKTWQGARGNVRDVHFSDLIFTEVENPIIIDQHYGDPQEKNQTGVHISDVSYSRAQGTTKTAVAINFNCSSSVACTNIALDNIQLKSSIRGQQLSSFCNNAYGITKGIVYPKSCLT